jgi:hypothetical protein
MHRFIAVVFGVGLALGLPSFAAAGEIAEELLVPAVSVDDGLGALPPASEWREPWLYALPAEKLDSGLGALPHVSSIIAVWLYAMPAESLDSGLGELADRMAEAARQDLVRAR